jgi:hypothetical protein
MGCGQTKYRYQDNRSNCHYTYTEIEDQYSKEDTKNHFLQCVCVCVCARVHA